MAGEFTPYGSGSYRIEVWERDRAAGRVRHLVLPGVERVSATRELSQISEANLDIPYPPDMDLADRLGGLRTIRFEIDAWRDDALIWSGPVTRLAWGRTMLKLSAKDFLWWLTRRFVRTRLAFENVEGADGTEDLAVIAEIAIRSALTSDDPDIARWLLFHAGGAVGVGRYETAERVTAMEVLDDLTPLGLDYTCLGRQIVVWSVDRPLPDLGPMTDVDFTDDLEVVEDAEDACTLAAVTGAGIAGEAGGTDSYIGLVERRFDADSTQTRFGPLQAAAAQQVSARNPAPLQINLPSGSLAPGCAIHPSRLVPGAYADLTVIGTPRQVRQTMRLQSVEFSRTGVDAEQVSVAFEPVGVLAQKG